VRRLEEHPGLYADCTSVASKGGSRNAFQAALRLELCTTGHLGIELAVIFLAGIAVRCHRAAPPRRLRLVFGGGVSAV